MISTCLQVSGIFLEGKTEDILMLSLDISCSQPEILMHSLVVLFSPHLLVKEWSTG